MSKRLLILGGTVFLGRHVAAAAMAGGWDVTLFNRGLSRPPPPGPKVVIGDRTKGLAALGEGTWDAVIDTSGYLPGTVQVAAEALRGRTSRYVFVSTVSVYAEFGTSRDESAPLMAATGPLGEEIRGANYGPLKAACEAVVAEAFGTGGLAVRPGLIVGPDDPTDRFTYWVRRFGQGGVALAPGDGSAVVQVLDVRDLAALLVATAAGDAHGLMNAAGPSLLLKDVLAACAAAAGRGAARPEWVAEAFLEEQKVAPWMDLPLWIPGVEQRIGTARAEAAGLRCRDIGETVAATREWDQTRNQAAPMKAGLTPEREADLLARWATRN